jgi:DNA-binding CsgD family transcriptional regulator
MPKTAAIVGRTSERRRVVDFVDAVATGPAALLLEGEPGIGKTILWADGVAAATERSYHVLSCRPVECETQLGYAALGDLLGGVPEKVLGKLPPPQRRAIDGALLRAEPEGEGALQRAVAVATLGVFRLLAREAPILLAVDDVQWLDQPSETALGFAVRRLVDERIGLLVARRTDPRAEPPLGLSQALPESRLFRLELPPFDRATLGQVVSERLDRTLPPPVLARLHRTTAGNPFYALEVGRALDGPEVGNELPIPASLQDLVGDRLASLTEPAREAVELAAALSRPTTLLIAAVMGVRRGPAAIDAATAAGVLESDGQRVRLAHPLLGSVAYARMSEAGRRKLHGRLATVIEDPEERAKHLALATDHVDESIAGVLDDAARRAAARGAPGAAAELLEHARRLTPPTASSDSLRRGIEAAERHFDAGYVERARALLEEIVETSPSGWQRARPLAALGWVRAHREGFHAGAEVFRAALAESFDDVPLRIEIEEGLAWCVHTTEDVPAARLHARVALELAEAYGDPSLLSGALSHLAFLETLEGQGVALPAIERALELGHAPHWSQILGRPDWVHGLLIEWSGELEAAKARFAALYDDAVVHGDEHALPFILFHLARIELLVGDWAAAEAHAREADKTTVDSGQAGERPYSLAIVALMDAHLGLVEEARARIDAGLRAAEQLGVRPAEIELLATRGFVELSCEEWARADHALDRARALIETSGLREPSLFRIHGDAIEAKIALGLLDDARELLVELELLAGKLDRAILRAVAGRCRGLLSAAHGDLAAAYPALEAALAHHPAATQPFEEGRTLVVLGSIQRRDRKKRATRESLGRALEIFERLGAPLWSARARAELARVGGRAPSGELTPTEAKVADLIAGGRTYREAADALFISPKTVQWNLSKIYRKLGVRSRAELAARLSSGEGATPNAEPAPGPPVVQ